MLLVAWEMLVIAAAIQSIGDWYRQKHFGGLTPGDMPLWEMLGIAALMMIIPPAMGWAIWRAGERVVRGFFAGRRSK